MKRLVTSLAIVLVTAGLTSTAHADSLTSTIDTTLSQLTASLTSVLTSTQTTTTSTTGTVVAMDLPASTVDAATTSGTGATVSTDTMSDVTTADTSYLSASAIERVSSYTYPSTKLSVVLTERLYAAAGALAIMGLFLALGGYEATQKLVAGVNVSIRRRARLEDVR